jgi:iron complex outermembrane receptor protein
VSQLGGDMKTKPAVGAVAALGVKILFGTCSWSAETQNAPPQTGATQGSSIAETSAASAGQSSSAADALQEVVVSAERRTLNALTTPISIQTISGDDLESQHLGVVADLQNVVPSLQVNTQGQNNFLNIRGVGSTAFEPTLVSGVGVFKDGFYMPSTFQLQDPFFDLANTQVLRGPQGTFAGFASMGGELDINSASPNFQGTNGYIEGAFGNYTDQKVDGAVNIPVSDTLAMRLAFFEETRGSFYRDNGAIVTSGASKPVLDPGSIDTHAFRLGTLWKPTDKFQALFKFEFNSTSNQGIASEPNQSVFILPPAAVPNGCPTSTTPTGREPAGPGGTCHSPYYAYSTHIPFAINISDLTLKDTFRDYVATLELRYTLPDDVVLRSLTGFWQDTGTTLGSLSNDSFNAGYSVGYLPSEDHYQQEFDLISPATGKLQWVAGAVGFYRNAPGIVSQTEYFPPPASMTTPEYININEQTVFRSGGVFANIDYQLTNSLQFQIGARQSWDNNSVYGTPPGPFVEVALPGTAAFLKACQRINPPAGYGCVPVIEQGSLQDKVPTGKVGLNWTPLEGQFLYAFYARGYQPGGYQGTSTFKPAYVNDYEMGWKTTDFNRHLQASIGGFWMTYFNMQEPLTDLVTGQADDVNLAPSTIKGIEVTATGRVGGFSVNFSGSYTRSKLGSSPPAIAAYALPPGAANFGQCGYPQYPAGACTNFKPYYVALSGEQNPYTPEFQGTLDAQYAFTVDKGSITPRVSYSYTASQYSSLFENSPYYYMGPRHIFNAFLSYQIGQLNVQAYGTNLTNEVYLSGQNASNVFYGAPRQFGISIRRDF